MNDKYQNILIHVKGFMEEIEGQGLYDTALKASTNGPCLEIGSYCGKSTIYIGSACKETQQVLFSIDHHRGSEEQQPGEDYYDPDLFDAATQQIDTFKFFRQTLSQAGLENTVVPIVSYSHIAAKAWKTPLSFVFIDGSHTFESARMDYACWTPHIIPGGYLVIHDIFPDPAMGGQAPFDIYSRALSSGQFVQEKMIKTLGILKKM